LAENVHMGEIVFNARCGKGCVRSERACRCGEMRRRVRAVRVCCRRQQRRAGVFCCVVVVVKCAYKPAIMSRTQFVRQRRQNEGYAGAAAVSTAEAADTAWRCRVTSGNATQPSRSDSPARSTLPFARRARAARGCPLARPRRAYDAATRRAEMLCLLCDVAA